MYKIFTKSVLVILLGVLCSNITNAQIVYVDYQDIVGTSDYTWEYFTMDPDETVWKNVGFGLWYNTSDSQGPTWRLETYSKDVVGTMIGDFSFLTPLAAGAEIGASSAWVETGEVVSQPDSAYQAHFTRWDYEDWGGVTGYVGYQFFLNGGADLHYGWMQFLVTGDGSSVTFYDYAYNSVPGAPIIAGQMVTDVNDEDNNLISKFKLNQNYPNPFNPTTNIAYSIANDSMVELTVYNSLGQAITNLVSENKKAGKYEVKFNAENLTSGVYYYTLKAGSNITTNKMLLLK